MNTSTWTAAQFAAAQRLAEWFSQPWASFVWDGITPPSFNDVHQECGSAPMVVEGEVVHERGGLRWSIAADGSTTFEILGREGAAVARAICSPIRGPARIQITAVAINLAQFRILQRCVDAASWRCDGQSLLKKQLGVYSCWGDEPFDLITSGGIAKFYAQEALKWFGEGI